MIQFQKQGCKKKKPNLVWHIKSLQYLCSVLHDRKIRIRSHYNGNMWSNYTKQAQIIRLHDDMNFIWIFFAGSILLKFKNIMV